MNYWEYPIICKMIRREGEIIFHKKNDNFFVENQMVLSLVDEIKVNNPSFLQKYRFIIIEGPKLLETDSSNDIIYTDYNGQRYFSKNVKVLSWF